MSNALTITELHKRYHNGFVALDHIDLEVAQGDFFGLLGPNGAGKTTTIGILTSLVKKTSGSVKIFGIDIDQHFAEAKQYLGVVPQEFNFSIFETPLQILLSQAGYYGVPKKLAKERAEFYLKRLSIWDKRHGASRMLSGGMKRRLMIARALMHEPQLLILDEPTAGVDIELRRQMWQFLKDINQQGKTIILTTHYLEEAESLCKRVAIIDHGKIIEQGETKVLLTKLHIETFVFDIKKIHDSIQADPAITHRVIDENTLEVDIAKTQSINQIVAWLNNQDVTIISMRNKANRLEELFVKLVGKNG